MRTSAAAALILSTLLAPQNTRPTPPRADLEATLAQVSRQVEAYYSRARAILCAERVVLQPLGSDLTPDGFARRLVYELRVEWSRRPVKRPRAALTSRGGCCLSTAGHRVHRTSGARIPSSSLPSRSPSSYPAGGASMRFRWLARDGRTDATRCYSSTQDASGKKPDIKWQDDCVSVDVPAKTRGRAWVDADTGDVLRLDERFAGLFDIPVPREQAGNGRPVVDDDRTLRHVRPISAGDVSRIPTRRCSFPRPSRRCQSFATAARRACGRRRRFPTTSDS